jgi:type IV fimbrial biogenesis protein FimT
VANELVSSLTLARSMAISQRAPTIMCRSANATAATPACGGGGNWEDGWIVFSDLNGDNAYNAATEPLWQQRGAAPALVEIGAGANVDPLVRFAPIGTAPGFNGTFAVCDDRKGEAKHASRMREIVVSIVGRVRARGGDGGTACPD